MKKNIVSLMLFLFFFQGITKAQSVSKRFSFNINGQTYQSMSYCESMNEFGYQLGEYNENLGGVLLALTPDKLHGIVATTMPIYNNINPYTLNDPFSHSKYTYTVREILNALEAMQKSGYWYTDWFIPDEENFKILLNYSNYKAELVPFQKSCNLGGAFAEDLEGLSFWMTKMFQMRALDYVATFRGNNIDDRRQHTQDERQRCILFRSF